MVTAVVFLLLLLPPMGSSERQLGCGLASSLMELRASVTAERSKIGRVPSPGMSSVIWGFIQMWRWSRRTVQSSPAKSRKDLPKLFVAGPRVRTKVGKSVEMCPGCAGTPARAKTCLYCKNPTRMLHGMPVSLGRPQSETCAPHQ